MFTDKAGSHQCPTRAVYSVHRAATRQCQVRSSEFSPFLQGYDFMDAIVGQKEAGIMLSSPGAGSLLLKHFSWAAVQTSLLYVLGLLLMCAIGFIGKLLWEKKQEHQTKEKLLRELNWRKAQAVDDWRKAQSYAALVTLDPDTANQELTLSDDRRSVVRKTPWHNLSKELGRFPHDPCVLGSEAFSSGKHYWEIDVGDRPYWVLGVCEESIKMTWGLTESPQNGFWAVELYGDMYQALTFPHTLLPLSEHPRSVGIFLDYEAGVVSFYSVPDGSHIFTFPQASFLGALRPFFCLWFYDPTPLTICH